ncbi:MAG: hypothetical protein Q4E35_08830 [Eubacteriales bacterium]|nr:hypothetical protein [Eubacteriales bacterium]
MKIYENTFIQGRELAKKLAVGTAVSCVAGILLAQMQSNLELIFITLTFVLFAATIYVIIKYCKCPYCGRRIFLGVLKVTSCPSCHRSFTTGKKVRK